jgi:iron complex transport system substrate-binding protein
MECIDIFTAFLVSKKMRTIFYIFISSWLGSLIGHAEPATMQALDYAKNFSIATYPTHTLLTVRNAYRNAKQPYRYALVPRDQALPEGLPADATIVRTPVERVVLMETVYVGYLAALEQLDTIRGAATASYMSHPEVVARVESGQIQRIQSGQQLNIERLLLLQPDLILTTSLGEGQDVSPQLQRAGLPVILTADYMEPHPLARTEWLKFLAPFFGCEARGDALFETIEADYTALLKTTERITERPSVFCGAPYSGTWHVPGGNSFIACAIHDAGANYLWADDASQGGLPLDTERVFLKAAEADFWIHPSHYRSLSELFAADPRFAKFRAARIGHVFNRTRQVSAGGGNNIWERGIVHPEEVLGDLIQIFHPDLMPDRELIYYENLQ